MDSRDAKRGFFLRSPVFSYLGRVILLFFVAPI